MAGREVFKHAVRSMSEAADRALDGARLTGTDIDLMIPHQANIRIIEATAKHANIPMEKVYVNVDRYGNTSSASIPIALDEAHRVRAHQGGIDRAAWSPSAPGSPGRPWSFASSPHAWTSFCCSRDRDRRSRAWAKDLVDAFPAARDAFAAVDAALGEPLSTLCFEGPAETLTLTHNAQPALLAHGAAVWAVGARARRRRTCAPRPAIRSASSRRITPPARSTLADAARLVRRRGELMYESGERRPGAMAAILGDVDEPDRGDLRAGDAPTAGVVVPANYNSPGQVVISGEVAAWSGRWSSRRPPAPSAPCGST